MARILGIETSCDETAIGIVEDGVKVLANVLASSQALHAQYGGVIPEIASRAHVEVIWQVLEGALQQAHCSPSELDAIAVTQGPGLPGALLIGLAFAKGLALSLNRPLIGVDHLAAHLYVGQLEHRALSPPYVGLVVSGGHTLLCVAHPDQRFEVLGETKDDAVGEAFDKVANLLGLGYPGGPAIDHISEEGRPNAIAFPRATTKQAFDFSFSGLKTAVYRTVQHHSSDHALNRQDIADIAASFQEAAVEILVTKTLRACSRTGIRDVVVGGGVAANRRLRQRLVEEGQSRKLRVTFPTPNLCVDNGVMVAGVAFDLLRRGRVSPLSLAIDPNLCLTNDN